MFSLRNTGTLFIISLLCSCSLDSSTASEDLDRLDTSEDVEAHVEEPSDEQLTENDGAISGQFVFDEETFGGNGRTCLMCHSIETGTINPDQIEALFSKDPSHPLFTAIDSDDGAGVSYQTLRERATIRVGLDLPSNVMLLDDPQATSVVVHRGIPSTMNTPALDPVLMWDGREQNLAHQAGSAVAAHAEPTREITDEEKDAVAQFQQESPRFFSSAALYRYAVYNGDAPSLPIGYTESEIRGKTFFEDDGLCGQCHGGPMLNATTEFNRRATPGSRFGNVRVSEFNGAENAVRTWVFRDEQGGSTQIESPDLGLALITGAVDDANSFKIPSLWGITKTGPYFHDNSSMDLKAVVDHYVRFFASVGRTISVDDQEAILAYLRLL